MEVSTARRTDSADGEDAPSGLRFRQTSVPLWVPAALLSIALRIPLLLLPGPGRDEAAYFYWASQGEFGYAPLMLWMVRGLTDLGIPALAAIRVPGLLGGTLALVLFDALLTRAGADRRSRAIGLFALALAPWQVWVGSVLHPDAWFLCALLGLTWAMRSRRGSSAALLGGAAALAKPTGFVLLPPLILWVWAGGAPGPRLAALGVLLGGIAVAATGLSPAMVREMAEFGRLDAELTALQCAVIGLQDVLIGGGFLLPLAAAAGLIARLRNGWFASWWPGPAHLIPAATLLVFFLVAALLNRQVKGSWILPALVLLWPPRELRLPRALVAGLLVASALSSAVMVSVTVVPSLASRIEAAIPTVRIYSERAGTREARVSPTRTWSDRFREYEDLTATAADVLTRWTAATGESSPPAWIVADDYGLAAQLAFHWRDQGTRFAIPDDGMFRRGVRELEDGYEGFVLLLACQADLTEVWPAAGAPREIGALDHPAAGGTIRLGLVHRERGARSR